MLDKVINFDNIIEITFVLIVLFLVFSRPQGFSASVRALSNAYIGAVKTLQGRD